MKQFTNPFSLTKAVDLSDEQIDSLWVDINSTGGFAKKAKPTSPMPMIIMGGKGSGKTHLMRHYAYHVQKLRAKDQDILSSIVKEGYLGIYVRTPGLNASRFREKSQSQTQWIALFAYYLELWCSQSLLTVFLEMMVESTRQIPNEPEIVSALNDLFDKPSDTPPTTLAGFVDYLQVLRRNLDFQINNAAFSRSLNVTILATNGRLIFGIPQVLQKMFHEAKDLMFLYLIDEYEHFDEHAQRYFNTLIREREFPVSFKVGVKLYGLKTLKTYSGDEGLKEGSEFERLTLDEDLRASPHVYQSFAIELCRGRLLQSPTYGEIKSSGDIAKVFVDSGSLAPEDTDWGRACARFGKRRRPCVEALERKLKRWASRDSRLGVTSDKDVHDVIELVEFDSDFLLEKTNCFLLYRAWYHSKSLITAAQEIRSDCERFFGGEPLHTAHARVLDKFGSDLRHQFIIEAEHKIDYLGLDAFILMSHGIARNLLTTLRGIYDWAQFFGEAPGSPMSARAQQIAVTEASDWFFQDAMLQSDGGKHAANAIDRLCDLFQAMRFSDKPSECSLLSFSVEWDGLDSETQAVIELAEKLSYLVRDNERRDRNTARPLPKFQLNRMLSPRYRLPIVSRGSIQLGVSEARAIFGDADPTAFRKVRAIRLKGLNAPFAELSPADENDEFKLL